MFRLHIHLCVSLASSLLAVWLNPSVADEILCNETEGQPQKVIFEHLTDAMLKQGPHDRAGMPWMGVATASSMMKILPTRPDLFRGTITNALALTAARGEMTAGQVVVCAAGSSLTLEVLPATALTNASGNRIEASNITFAPIGFTHTLPQTNYVTEHVGWWPDPILTHLKQLRVDKDALQPFWTSVRVPRDCVPGTFMGIVCLRSGRGDCEIPLTVTVWNFTLPEKPSLDTAVTVSLENVYSQHAGNTPEAIEPYHIAFEKFMAEHRFNYGSLYKTGRSWRGPLPTRKELLRWKTLGMGSFNIMCATAYNTLGSSPKGVLPDVRHEEFKKTIHGVLAEAEAAGVRSNAYLYGWDEWKAPSFPEIRKTAAWLKREFPDLPLFTTAIDKTYGSALPEIDWFCPEIYNYKLDRARAARQRGKKVWWYVCVATKKPYANVFLDYPAIDARLLTGFMSFNYEVDGFLYYSMIRAQHNEGKLLLGGPFLDWDARSWNYAHGDGHLVYPGIDGPISSIRMENLLDGMEDYDYLVLAKQAVNKLRKAGDNSKADQLESEIANLLVPGNDVVFDLTHYTSSPDVVEAARRKLAAVILAAGG